MILENTLSKGDTIIAEGKGRSSRQELKLLYLRDYFYKYTNRDTPKRMDAILKYLAANDIPASRVTICNDIEILRNTLHIPIKYSAKDYGYYVEKPQFESHEMLMLLDCIRFPTFITEDETERLRQKLMALASVYDSELVNNVAPGETHVLKAKVSVYDNLRILLDAIRKGRSASCRFSMSLIVFVVVPIRSFRILIFFICPSRKLIRFRLGMANVLPQLPAQHFRTAYILQIRHQDPTVIICHRIPHFSLLWAAAPFYVYISKHFY